MKKISKFLREFTSEQFWILYIYLLTAAIGILLLVPSWMKVSPTEIFSFKVGDGWCDLKTQGFSNHCFSDFYGMSNVSVQDNPWKTLLNPNSPVTTFIFSVFSKMSTITSDRFTLFVFLVLNLIGMLAPVIYFLKQSHLKAGVYNPIAMLLIVLSVPFLTNLDRGTMLGILNPLFYLLYSSFTKERLNQFIFLGVILTLLKPQFLSLGIVFLFSRQYFMLLKWTFLSIISFLGSFLLYPKNITTNIQDFISTLTNYQTYLDYGSLVPVNLSFSNALGILLRIFHVKVDSNILQSFSYFILVISIFYIWRFSQYANRAKIILIAFLIPILFLGVTFHYYLILILPILLFGFIRT
jgi:hypothetical protein